ncbi:hypothetical protein AHF37_10324 [Paragonimus kellicotti]|nr:hypothetical protein AHF37_10324 [Paragonimus kellicotti]
MSLSTAKDMQTVALLLKSILLKGGFRLTKFYSNVQDAFTDIPKEDLSSITVNLDRQQTEAQKALGVVWDSQSDNIRFKVSGWQGQITRRTILSYVASLFDPLGLVAPVLLTAKRLLQELCRKKVDWDGELASEEIVAWQEWLHGLAGLTELRIPRCIKPRTLEGPYQMELHGFSDASEAGYGAAIYARLVATDGSIYCSLVLGKSRVAPMRAVSIPRMELTAAVLAAKLISYVKEELLKGVKSVTLWTDSMIVLQLIRNTSSRFETFVANRLSSIHDLSSPDDWRYVDTKRNPADLASRGMHPKDQRTREWFSGPEFLWKDQVAWPVQPQGFSDELTELKPKERTQVFTTLEGYSWFNCFSLSCSWGALLLTEVACLVTTRFLWLHKSFLCQTPSPYYFRRRFIR